MGPRQRQGRSRSKTHALPIILLSFLGFLLIAGVAFGIGMIGNVNRWLSDLPDYTDANAYLVSEPTEIVDCNGNKIASFYTQNRKSVTKDQVSPYVLQGTVDVEDERFYEHGGIDLWGIARAAVATASGGHEGASTITQQLVRNTILQEEQFDSTIERKVREAYIAVKMEDMPRCSSAFPTRLRSTTPRSIPIWHCLAATRFSTTCCAWATSPRRSTTPRRQSPSPST